MIEKLKSLTILYAEDEEGIRSKISDSLRYYVKDVVEAEDGEVAFKLFKNKKPNIVFTDILMPKRDGIELVRNIRKIDKDIPIVMITAHTEKEYLLKLVDLHLDHYLIKPINLGELKKALIKCLDILTKQNNLKRKLYEEWEYSFSEKTISCDKQTYALNKKEIALLELLLHNEQRVVTYSEIEQIVWEDDIMSMEALKSLIRNIRKKLPKNYIKNYSGIGYKINDYQIPQN